MIPVARAFIEAVTRRFAWILWPVWAAAGVGAALILLSLTLDHGFVAERSEPPAFRWWLFALGLGVALAAIGLGTVRRAERD